MSRQVLGIFLAVRLLNALTLRTFWSPDEYWQSLEVAHRLVYGYGYLTWEWTTRIRSATHPLVFAVLYKLLNILGLDRSYAVYINAPMIFQGALSATGEYYTWKLAGLTFGTGTQRWLLVLSVFSWFHWYVATRTFINTFETFLSSIANYYWFKSMGGNIVNFRELSIAAFIGGLCCSMRPPSVIFWIAMASSFVGNMYRQNRNYSLALRTIVIGALSALSSSIFVMALDSCYFGKLTLTGLNFFSFNVAQNVSQFYGSHSALWYFTQGIPAILGLYIIPCVLGAYRIAVERRRFSLVLLSCFFSIVVYSLIAHKEFRFVYFLLPHLLICSAFGLHTVVPAYKSVQFREKTFIAFMLVSQVFIAIYLGNFHQAGVMDAVRWIHSSDVVSEGSVFFAMPCHSTPFHSHIHRQDIDLLFLTCEPPVRYFRFSYCFS
eukprot:Partr_v1_DN26938_c0_g1_i7_m7192 putative phosphatidylinositol glycan anchor biosynthesis, class B